MESGKASIDELSAVFGVSGMTIRRDLTILDKQGKLRRLHGGAAADHLPGEKNLSSSTAGKNRSQPDVLILNPMDQRTARLIVQKYSQINIPVIAESIPFPGIATLIAIDSYKAGRMLGDWVAKYIQSQMARKAKIMFVGTHSYTDTAERERGFFDGLNQIINSPLETIKINGQGLRKESYQVSLAVISTHPDIDIMIGVNDQATLGILEAIYELKRPLEEILIGTFGLEGSAGKEMVLQKCPRSVGVAMFPEWIGHVCVDMAILAYNHLKLPEQVVMPVRIVTNATLANYFTFYHNTWKIQQEIIHELQDEENPLITLPEDGIAYPARIGFVRYLHDDYYEQLIKGMQLRAKEFGIDVHINDASQDLAVSIDLARKAIAQAAAELINPGDSVIIDAGSSNLYLAEALARRTDCPVTVVSHSLPVLERLGTAKHITLIAIGGTLNRESQCFLGSQAETAIDGLHADKAFLGVTGVSILYGITNANFTETEIKRCILKAAGEVIVLADSYKIGEVALARIAPISAFKKLVCDDQMTSQDRVAFTQAGIEIVIAENRSSIDGETFGLGTSDIPDEEVRKEVF
jgi:DeoR family fructose operon transcriptional repressor